MTDEEKCQLDDLAEHVVQLADELVRIGNRLNDIIYDLRYVLAEGMKTMLEAKTEYTEEQEHLRRLKERLGSGKE